jgi:hypothetical protein
MIRMVAFDPRGPDMSAEERGDTQVDVPSPAGSSDVISELQQRA